MREKKLIAVDLDGTLFGADHQVSPRTADAIHAVTRQGHAVVVVTGRSAHSALPRLTALPEGVRVVCSNGAYEAHRTSIVEDAHRASHVKPWSQSLAVKFAVTIRQQILLHMPNASFGWETDSGVNYEDKFAEEAGGVHTLEQGGVTEAFGYSDVLKLYVRTPELTHSDLQQAVLRILDHQAEVSTSGVPFIELTAPGVDKAKGLARIAADLGIRQSHTIAFGDNLNDLPMLRWANESVAMGNAADAVKLAANTQALTNVEDGVAVLLEDRLSRKQL